MELRDAVLHRRMVRRFDPATTVPPDVVRDLVALAVRAPSPASCAPRSITLAALATSGSQYGTGPWSVDRSVQPLSGSA